MATKIISKNTNWDPVKIEINFETREQLAVFVEVMGKSSKVRNMIVDEVNESGRGNLACGLIHGMSSCEIEDSFNEIIDIRAWEQLKNIVNN